MRIERKNWKKSYFLFNCLCRSFLLAVIFISILSCRTLFKTKGVIPTNLSSYTTGGTFSGVFTFYEQGQ